MLTCGYLISVDGYRLKKTKLRKHSRLSCEKWTQLLFTEWYVLDIV